MRIDNTTFKQPIFVYRSRLYKATVNAAVESGTFKSRSYYAKALSLVSRTQPVDWDASNLVQAFAWGLTILPSAVWANVANHR